MHKQVLNYSSSSIFFHWLIALIVIPMVIGSFFLEEVPKAYQPLAYLIHKSMGLTVLLLMLLRMISILYNGKPPLPDTVPAWQKIVSHLVHYGLYFFVILMSLSGWIMSTAANRPPSYFGLFTIPFPGIVPNEAFSNLMVDVHITVAWIIIALLVLHIAGAIKHHFIDKDKVLLRMWRR